MLNSEYGVLAAQVNSLSLFLDCLVSDLRASNERFSQATSEIASLRQDVDALRSENAVLRGHIFNTTCPTVPDEREPTTNEVANSLCHEQPTDQPALVWPSVIPKTSDAVAGAWQQQRPPECVLLVFVRHSHREQNAWILQHRPFNVQRGQGSRPVRRGTPSRCPSESDLTASSRSHLLLARYLCPALPRKLPPRKWLMFSVWPTLRTVLCRR